MIGNRGCRPNKQAGANDGANAKGNQRPAAESALECALPFAAVLHQAVNRFCSEEVVRHVVSSEFVRWSELRPGTLCPWAGGLSSNFNINRQRGNVTCRQTCS